MDRTTCGLDESSQLTLTLCPWYIRGFFSQAGRQKQVISVDQTKPLQSCISS